MMVQSMVLNMTQVSLVAVVGWGRGLPGGVNDYRLASDLSTDFGHVPPLLGVLRSERDGSRLYLTLPANARAIASATPRFPG